MSVTATTDWTMLASCQGTGDAMFPEPRQQRRARQICVSCPVVKQCLAEALDEKIEWGVWGGKTERERRLILRRRPDVPSWRAVLCPEGDPVVAPQPTATPLVALAS